MAINAKTYDRRSALWAEAWNLFAGAAMTVFCRNCFIGFDYPVRAAAVVQTAIPSANSNLGGHLRFFSWPSAPALFAHGLNLAEVFRATLGGCFSATATEGNGGGIFLCHARRVQKAVAVCKRELCINSIQKPIESIQQLW